MRLNAGCARLVRICTPLGVLLAALLAGGCRETEPYAGEPLDPRHFVSEEAGEAVAFSLTFARYNLLESDVISEAWKAVQTPDEAVCKLWAENGLRIALAKGEDTLQLRQALSGASTFRALETRIMMPSQRNFDIYLGRGIESGGIIYATAKAKGYRDVTGFRLIIRGIVLGRGADTRLTLAPVLTEPEQGTAEAMEGLLLTFPAEEGMIILIGPVGEPDEKSLGALLRDEDAALGDGRLLIVEARRAR